MTARREYATSLLVAALVMVGATAVLAFAGWVLVVLVKGWTK